MTTHTTPATGTTTTDTTTTDDEFLALVLADPALLEAEFAEITADTRLCPPPPKEPRTVRSSDHPTPAHTANAAGIQPVTRPHAPGTEAWNRQRSPPTTLRPDVATRPDDYGERQVIPST